MKLIDLLVKELPSRGGWPEEAEYCWQDFDKEVRPESSGFGFYLNELAENHRAMRSGNPEPGDTNCVTREQYEAAVAALQQEAWNGEGLPTVGTECEWQDKNTKQWQSVTVVYASEWVIVIRDHGLDAVELGIDIFGDEERKKFRPIRTEAECQREAVIDTLANLCHRGDPGDDAQSIYDAIAAHKITGVTLVPTVSQIVRAIEKCSREDAERIVALLNGGNITE